MATAPQGHRAFAAEPVGTRASAHRPDGAEVVAYRQGPKDPAPPAVLILDGIGCSGWAFRHVIPALSAPREVLLMHYRGHGESPVPPRPWQLGIPTLADDAAAILDQAAVDRAVLVGFSMGFQVALEIYRRHRDRVAGLVSLGGPAGRAMAGLLGTGILAHALPLLRVATRHAPRLSDTLWKALLPSGIPRTVGLWTQVNPDLVPRSDFDFYLAQMAKMSPELFVEMLSLAHRHVAHDVLPQIRVPTLVVAGRGDTFVPLRTLRQMAFRIPNARWVVVPDATHALPAERPDEVVRHIESIVSDLE
jgi:pimeloyl-ACP methyl ester carboxylesterase